MCSSFTRAKWQPFLASSYRLSSEFLNRSVISSSIRRWYHKRGDNDVELLYNWENPFRRREKKSRHTEKCGSCGVSQNVRFTTPCCLLLCSLLSLTREKRRSFGIFTLWPPLRCNANLPFLVTSCSSTTPTCMLSTCTESDIHDGGTLFWLIIKSSLFISWYVKKGKTSPFRENPCALSNFSGERAQLQRGAVKRKKNLLTYALLQLPNR